MSAFQPGGELINSLTAKESTRHAIAPQAYVEFYSLITRVRLPRHTTKGATYTEITAKAARIILRMVLRQGVMLGTAGVVIGVGAAVC